jgi:hypothetical protein
MLTPVIDLTGHLNCDFGLYVNALKVEFDPESSSENAAFNSHYLYLIGRFDAKDKGPRSAFGGSIKDAKVIALWSAPKTPPTE